MSARYKQLQDFNKAGEADEINRKQAALLVEASAESKSGCRKNHQMLKVMGDIGLWPRPAGTTDRTMMAAAKIHATIWASFRIGNGAFSLCWEQNPVESQFL